MMPPTQNPRHSLPLAASAAASQAIAALRPSPFTGMLATSPFGGVTMRQRQSSVTTATQLPVRSIGAPWRAVGGGPGGPPPCRPHPRPRARQRPCHYEEDGALHRAVTLL